MRQEQTRSQGRRPNQYQNDPVAYAHEVLKIERLWDAQVRIAEALLKPPYKVLVKSGHKIGKSHAAAWLINWWYDQHDPGGIITIAPKFEHLVNILWKDIRLQRMRAGLAEDFIGPRAPEMRSNRTSPDHYAMGITANRGEAVTGRHEKHMLFVFDECTGVDSIYWTTAKSMFKPDGSCGWLCLCNPVNTATQAYLEDQSGEWTVIELSCMDHPNIEAQLLGAAELPVPQAVTSGMIDGWTKDWSTPITEDEREETDFEWPKGSGQLWRPGPEMESRCFGRWPSQGTYGVWSDSLWRAATELHGKPRIHDVPINDLPQFGCDVARFGDDNTAIHVRWGDTSLHHEYANGWKTTQTVGRIIELARHYADMVNRIRARDQRTKCRPEDLPIKVDDDGVGGGVTDMLMEQGFNAYPVRSGQASLFPTKYPNKRSEMWFATAQRAREGRLALGQLDKDTLHRIKSQAMAPEWELDSAGRRVVERKDVTKEKIGRSPDDMDAVNLAYYEGIMWEAPQAIAPPNRDERDDQSSTWLERRAERPRENKRRLFGR